MSKVRYLVALLVSVLVVTASCAPAAQTSKEAPLTKMKVVYSGIGGSQAILQVIVDAGIFRKHGLDVEPVFVEGGSPAVKAVVAADVPLAVVAGAAVIEAKLAGADVVMLIGHHNVLDWSVIGGKGITKPEDLRGKKVAILRFGDTIDLAARIAIKRLGMEPEKDVALVQVGSPGERVAALQSGAVQAAILTLPQTLMTNKLGFVNLVDLGKLGVEYQAVGVMSTRAYVKNNEGMVRNFVKAWVEGEHFFKTNKEASVTSMAGFLRVDDREAVEQTWDYYRQMSPQVPYPTVKGIQVILDSLAGQLPAAKTAKPEDFVDLRFVKELDDSGFIKQLYGP